MDQTGELAPQTGLAQVLHLLPELFGRYLTPISIGVALIGLALVFAGPVRTMLDGPDKPTGGDGRLLAPLQGQSDLAALAGGDPLTRQLAPFTTIPDRPRDRVITYTVQPGDTLVNIADMFGLDRTTVFWSNSAQLEGDVHMLRPGMDLYILPMDGVYHVSDEKLNIQQIADKYSVDPDVIRYSEYNELSEYPLDAIPPWGMPIVVPGGVGEFADWRPPIVETRDRDTGVVLTSFMPNMPGSCSADIEGYGGTGSWVLPLESYTLTQSFYPGHYGVDLAAPVGTPVGAADAGVVIFAGWNDWGYGNLVVLDHGNGWTTYYGHLSTVGVSCGQFVERGGYIGGVGSTGKSSGPHLHFEMRYGHTPHDPAGYLPI